MHHSNKRRDNLVLVVMRGTRIFRIFSLSKTTQSCFRRLSCDGDIASEQLNLPYTNIFSCPSSSSFLAASVFFDIAGTKRQKKKFPEKCNKKNCRIWRFEKKTKSSFVFLKFFYCYGVGGTSKIWLSGCLALYCSLDIPKVFMMYSCNID